MGIARTVKDVQQPKEREDEKKYPHQHRARVHHVQLQVRMRSTAHSGELCMPAGCSLLLCARLVAGGVSSVHPRCHELCATPHSMRASWSDRLHAGARPCIGASLTQSRGGCSATGGGGGTGGRLGCGGPGRGCGATLLMVQCSTWEVALLNRSSA